MANATFPLPSATPPTRSPVEESCEPEGSDGSLGTVEQLVRHPAAFLAVLDGPELSSVVRTLLVTIAVAGGVFGATMGTYRGGIQIAYAAVKVPILLLATLVISTPAFIGIARGLRLGVTPREVIAITLGASARFALVLAGLAPVVWLLSGWMSYHSVALTITAACALAGLSASALLFRGLSHRGGQGVLAGMCVVTVFGLVGSQNAWMLRPFLVRPKTVHVPFVRPIEGDLAGSVRASVRSASGVYSHDSGEWLGRRHQATPAEKPVPAKPNARECEGDSSCD